MQKFHNDYSTLSLGNYSLPAGEPGLIPKPVLPKKHLEHNNGQWLSKNI